MTNTLRRPSTTGAMRSAANSGTGANPAAGCPDCVKHGLAILPVVPTTVPVSLRGKSAELSQLDNRFQAPDLKAHWLVLRSLPAGYLYVMKTDLTWDAYVVDSDGMLRMTAPALAPARPSDTKPLSETCKRGGDNVPAQVIAIDPKKHATVWMAFSRYRWTPAVLQRYASNEGGCRDRRMTKLDVMAAAAGLLGGDNTAANAVKFGVPMSPAVGSVVADYASRATTDLLNRNVVTPIRDRSQFGPALAAKMAQISRLTQGKTGAVIALGDDLGMAIDTNAARNVDVARLGAFMLEHQRERLIGDIIEGFEKSFVDNGQTAEWNKRYVPHYDRSKLLADKAVHEAKLKTFNASIAASSADVALLLADAKLQPVWRDFDAKDDQSAKDRQEATAACLHGTVKSKPEQALWDRWLAEKTDDPNATLWGAVTALDPDLGAFLVGKGMPDVGKTDKLNDVIKNIREARNDFMERLEKRRSDEALAVIGTATASQLARAQMLNPALYKVAGMRMVIVASVRTSVTVTPVSVQMSQTQQAMMMAEATFGPPQPKLTRLLDLEAESSKRVYVVGTNGVDAYAFASTTTTTQKVRAVELWLPDEVVQQLRLPAPVSRLALMPPKVNPFAALIRFSKSTSGVFAWVGLTLQAMNLGNSVKDLASPGDDKSDAWFGTVSGTLGVTGVMAEITAGAMQKMTSRFVVNAFAKVAFAGGVLAGLSSLADGIQAGVKAVDRSRSGDVDARNDYVLASASLLMSGIAGLGGALAVGSAAGAFTGALGFLAGIGTAAAAVPVWGWIVAGVIFLGVGLALVWKAIRDTDNPLEEWLKGCLYGRGPRHFSAKEETDALNGVIYAVTVQVEWTGDAWELNNANFWDDYDSFKFSISLPNAGAASVIDCKVVLLGLGGMKEIFHETIRPRLLNGAVTDPHITTIGPSSAKNAEVPRYIWWEPPAIRSRDGGGVRYGGLLKLDDALYQEARVELSYWPDQAAMPNFVLPGAGQRILIGKK